MATKGKKSLTGSDDPLAGLLSDKEQDAPKKPVPRGLKSSSEKMAEWSKEKEPSQTPLHTVAPVKKRVMFEDDDDDDRMDAMGLGSGSKRVEKQGKAAEEEEIRPARYKLDELLGRSSVAKILEQPGAGERLEFKLDKKYQKQPEKEGGWDEKDFSFGAYQPTMASLPRAQLTRRQSASGFSAENSSEPKPEPQSKPPAASGNSVRSSRAGSNWLGLKDEDFVDLELPSVAKASPAESQPSPASQRPAAKEAATKPDPLEDDDWLTTALAQKKAQAQAKAQERNAKPSEAAGEGLDLRSPVSQPAASTGAPQPAAVPQDKRASAGSSRESIPWLSSTRASAHPPEAAKGDPSRDASAPGPTASFPWEQETQGPAPLAQVTIPRAHLQAAPQLQAESLAPGLLQDRKPGAPAARLYEDTSACQAVLLSTQARVAELESQVRTLELERAQHKLLLESLQQQRQEELDLLESAHRSRLKVVEEAYGQREQRLQQEKEQLAAQLLTQTQDAERARAELVAQHQQHVATLEQQRTLELERLRELHRVSVQEIRKEHEEQLQRLKRLKDQEIDAVTSATSHTRSLNGVIEQMEKFSSDLHDLSHKVEVTHHTTSQELTMEARQRDRQLRVLQDRLLQQQKDMEEERSRLQEVIAKMEARLNEQTRLLEQERWRLTAEQAKVESLQHSLEEQRRVMNQQFSMERAELDRAKSALLEEQKLVLQKCSEERGKLAAEWAEFHSQQQEQAELKLRGHELKAKEEQLARDRELLDKALQELKLEKEKVNEAALSIWQREEEFKSMKKLSSQKYEEGEQALWEASKMESKNRTRLQAMQQQLDHLRKQEQHLQQERLSMAQQRRQLEKLREELPKNPVKLLTRDQDLGGLTKGLSLSSTLLPPRVTAPPAQLFPPPVRAAPQHSPRDSVETLAGAGPTEFYAKLLLLTHRAQQDHAFLETEQFFLETLKKASYSTSSLLD